MCLINECVFNKLASARVFIYLIKRIRVACLCTVKVSCSSRLLICLLLGKGLVTSNLSTWLSTILVLHDEMLFNYCVSACAA